MPPSPLPLAIKSSGMDIEDHLDAYLVPTPDLNRALHISDMFRRLAIGSFLMSSDPAPFLDLLGKGARSYLYFLKKGNAEKQVLSKGVAFFDAIVARDNKGAEQIATLSRDDQNKDYEYEDDFLYFRYLIQKFLSVSSNPILQKILDRYEEVLDGEFDPRFDICKSFQSKDKNLFQEAITDYTEAICEKQRELILGEKMFPDEMATTAKISIELTALCLFAKDQNFDPPPLLRLVPQDILQDHLPPSFDDESWKHLPSFREITVKD